MLSTNVVFAGNSRPPLTQPFSARPFNALSEGGLFHYGDDSTIRLNLEALRAYSGPSFRFAGSLGIDTPENRAAIGFTGTAVRYFTMDAFEALARRSGWKIERCEPTLRSACVRLAKA